MIIEWASEPVRSFSIICREAEDRARLPMMDVKLFLTAGLKKTANGPGSGNPKNSG